MSVRSSPIPGWAIWLSLFVAAVVAIVVGVQLYRRGGRITLEEQREMQIIIGSVAAVVGGTLVGMELIGRPPIQSVLVGLCFYSLVLAAQHGRVTSLISTVFPCPYRRRAATWGALSLCCWLGWIVVGVESRLSIALGLAVLVSTMMMIYDLLTKHDDIEFDLQNYDSGSSSNV